MAVGREGGRERERREETKVRGREEGRDEEGVRSEILNLPEMKPKFHQTSSCMSKSSPPSNAIS